MTATVASRAAASSVLVGRREHALVLLAIGVAAIHVLDDSFLQPERGTSAGDHLVSGLVPLAVLLLVAAAYRRLGPRPRAAIALSVGPVVIASGIEAAYYTVKVGPSGDDYTGLLAVPAGIVLTAVGVVTLWKTRRRNGSRRRRYAGRLLVGTAGAVYALSVVFPIALSYVLTHVANPVVPKAELGPRYERVKFRTTDGLKLAGWYVPSRNRAAVIAFPGRSEPQEHARMLASHGYGVLLLDRRGEGESEGDPYRWAANEDLKAAATYLAGRPDVDPGRVGGLGLSLGGELMLEAAAQTKALKAVVSEGAGIRTTREELHKSGAAKWAELPFYSLFTVATAVFSNHAPPADLRTLVGRIAPRPVFLIFATHGLGGEDINPALYTAAGNPKTLWEIPEADHNGGLDSRPAEYERRVVGFLDHAA